MDIRARKIYEALFALEDLREIFRHALPTGLDESEEAQLLDGIARVETIIRGLKEGKSSHSFFIF
jgi:Sep-tRNA:Cys-tRNA synthetase